MAESKDRIAVIRECLEYKDPIGVKKLILEDKFKDEAYFWELITILGDCLNEENLEQCQGFFEVCERCINYIIRVGNPAELLLALLEQADTFNDTVKFQTFLQIIQKALLSLSSRQTFSLELSLETLSDCVRNLQLPKHLDLDGEERRAHDLDPDVDKINRYILRYLEFLTPFVKQVSFKQDAPFKGENFQRQADSLVKCLLSILDHPLLYLDLTDSAEGQKGKVKSDTRICVEKLMQMLVTMHGNPIDIIKQFLEHNVRIKRHERRRKHFKNMESNKDSCTDGDAMAELMSIDALSCLNYLIHVEQLAPVVYPCLLTPQGIMESNLVFVLALLQHTESEVQRKGVFLLQKHMNMQTDSTSLTCMDLDRPEYFKILDVLFHIMVHCSVKDIRQACLQQVPVFFSLFGLEARYRIYTKLFATVKHPGVYGLCVQYFKTQLEQVLSVGEESLSGKSQFCNVGLNKIFNLITFLPQGAATDLVENSDKIISVLNLCRYIVLRDPPCKNWTGFWNFSEKVEKSFLSELQTGLDMSRAHYKMELAGVQEQDQSKPCNIDMSVSVAGFKLPKMDKEQKIEIYRQALNTLDLIASLLARLTELMDQQKKQSKI